MTDATRNFDRAAATWDENTGRIKMAANIANAILNAVPLDQNMNVLDFGCGTGLLSLQFQPLVASLTGMDSSAGMLEVLNQKIASQDLSNINTRYVDIEKGDVLGGLYDLVICSMTLHHIRNPRALMVQFKSVCSPNGYICIADLDSDGGLFHGGNNEGVFHNGFDRELMRQFLRQAGFENIQFRTAAEVVRFIPGGLKPFSIFLATAQNLKK